MDIGLPCLFKAFATASTVSAEANIPLTNQTSPWN